MHFQAVCWRTYRSKSYRKHRLHAGIFYGAQQPFFTEESSSSQCPEPYMFYSHRNKLCIWIWPEFCYKYTLVMTSSAGNFGTWQEENKHFEFAEKKTYFWLKSVIIILTHMKIPQLASLAAILNVYKHLRRIQACFDHTSFTQIHIWHCINPHRIDQTSCERSLFINLIAINFNRSLISWELLVEQQQSPKREEVNL